VTAGGFPQNYFNKLAGFSACENDRQPAAIYHAIHHNFTTKTPRKNTDFSSTPLKKAHKPQKPPFPAAHRFFLK
jgi:hypothetical protein